MNGNPLAQLVYQSDLITKVVLIILLVMSIICWAIFFYKLLMGSMKKKQLRNAIRSLQRVYSVDELRSYALSAQHTMPGYVIGKNLSLVKALAETKEARARLNERELNLMQQSFDQTIDEVITDEESYLPFFAACAAVSPLLGLFGTVWGLVHAFIGIAEKQQADIATVAPGIAEALITTLAGLLVAIPAMVMYHYLQNQVRTIEHYLSMLHDKFTLVINTLFVG
jgi:biopolymer transport protein TolQ